MSQLNCLLDTGVSRICMDSTPGNVEIYIANFDSANTYTTDADGVITAMTSANEFFKFEFPRNTASFVETSNVVIENDEISYSQVVGMVLNKRDAQKRNLMLLLGKATTIIIVKDKNGLYTVVGKETGANLTAGTNQSGVAPGERNGYTFEFTAVESVPAPFIEFDAFSALISATQI